MSLLDPYWGIYSPLVPYVFASIWGGWLFYRYRDRRPREAKWVAAAIILLVVGLIALKYEHPILDSAWGRQLVDRNLATQGTLMGLFRLPYACALGCLCWVIFGNARQVEASDDVPPVFRREGEAG